MKRCAVYTRKSSEEGLEQEFNSLDAQREACESYIKSQKHEGWKLLPDKYDDGGFSGGNMERPALKRLLQDIESGAIDIIVVYKVDRLTRSLTDFAKLVELMDKYNVSFVSVTQQFNTTTSMGRLTLNVLLSFAQFEREVTGERIRDKIALSKQKGKWMGGTIPTGYDVKEQKLIINEDEAKTICHIFNRYTELKSVNLLKAELDNDGYCTKTRTNKSGKQTGGKPFSKGNIYRILKNHLYIGHVNHKDKHYPGEHEPIIEEKLFYQVQELLSENAMKNENSVGAKSPCLLAGKLFDDRGNYMTPKHSRTRKRHYRYYTSQAIIQSRHHEAGSLPNIPAGEVEQLVKSEIYGFLKNKEKMQNILQNESLSEQNNLIKKANELQFSDTEQERIFIRSIINRVKISDNDVEIIVFPQNIIGYLREEKIGKTDENEQSTVTIHRKIKLAKANNGSKVIIGSISKEGNPQLVKAITRSFLWHEQLINGEIKSQTEILERENMKSKSYIYNILQLRFLALDIIESIMNSNAPSDWTVEKLFKVKNLSWKEQRIQLGLV